MTLDLFKNLANEIKESKLVQNFIKEISNYIEKNSELKLAKNKYEAIDFVVDCYQGDVMYQVIDEEYRK